MAFIKLVVLYFTCSHISLYFFNQNCCIFGLPGFGPHDMELHIAKREMSVTNQISLYLKLELTFI